METLIYFTLVPQFDLVIFAMCCDLFIYLATELLAIVLKLCHVVFFSAMHAISCKVLFYDLVESYLIKK